MATDQLTDFIAARSDASTGSKMYKRDVKGSEPRIIRGITYRTQMGTYT